LQGLTPDRFPDLTAALAGAAGVISAATLVMLLVRARRSLVLPNWTLTPPKRAPICGRP
jgi:hypothetical protein